jgi:integrase
LVDLRGVRGTALGVRPGRYALDLPPGADELDATHAAYELVERLRRSSPQLPLPDPGAGRTFAAAVDAEELARRKDRPSSENARYVFGYLKQVRRELGHLPLVCFEGEAGADRLVDYRNELADKGLSPRTRANRICTTMQVLVRARRLGWLVAVPAKPDPCVGNETLLRPTFQWISETDFRSIRGEVFSRGHGLERVPADERPGYIAQRRLYLSWAFYTGMHTWDLNALDDSMVSVEFGSYERRNHKSSKSVLPAWFDMPGALQADCAAELARLGRPWRAGELICGGPWGEVTRTVTAAAKRLGMGPVDMRTMRRSCAHEYCLRGWSARDVADILGHVDDRLVNRVYSKVHARLRSPVKVPWSGAAGDIKTATGTVLPFNARKEGAK